MDDTIDENLEEDINVENINENSDIIKIKTKTFHIKPKSTPIFTRSNKNEFPFKIKTYPLREVIKEPKEEVIKVEQIAKEDKQDKDDESDEEKKIKSKKNKKKIDPVLITTKKNKKKTPNYALMPIEDQNKYRARFKAQFFLLRDTWGNTVPEINDEMSLIELHELYEMYIKNIHVKNSAGKYKVYIVLMWLCIEWVCIKMGLDIGGYTMAQFKSMSKYERLLLELGEKNYTATMNNDDKWPVEMNIMYIALTNALLFIIIKKISEYIGEGLANGIIEALTKVMVDDDLQPGNVLFGGNDDITSKLVNFGSMFMKSQQSNTAVDPAKTPTFKPVYDG